MIISKSRNFIFVHVPKAAGTSVSRHLSQFTEAGDVDINPPLSAFAEFNCREFGLRKHTSAQEIRAFVGPDAFSSAFKFAFVRNPYARLFSLYNFLKFKWRRWEGGEIMDQFPRFADFVRSDFFACGKAEGAGRDSIYRLFGSQMFWLCEDGERPLLDFVGRVERLEADFDHICAGVGLPAPGLRLDRMNVSDEFKCDISAFEPHSCSSGTSQRSARGGEDRRNASASLRRGRHQASGRRTLRVRL